MGRFGFEEAENYGGNGGNSASYFSLRDDGDVAKVRFCYNSIEDVTGIAVHEVSVNDKRRYVSCLREYNQPIDVCPMCAARTAQLAKLFVPIYDIDSDQIKFWERGKKFFAKMSSLCSHYPNLVSHKFEIERHGKKGDTGTTYEIYECEKDNTTLEDLPEIPELIGGIILDKSADEMKYYLENGSFPNGNSGGTTRRSSSSRDDEMPVRRTPTSGRRGDAF